MTLKLKIHWLIWFILVLVVASGTAAFFISGSPDIAKISLNPNETIDVPVFRVLSGAPLKIAMEFDNPARVLRPELGNYRQNNSQGGWNVTGKLEFPSPGEPIKLLVRGAGRDVVFEAMPARNEGKKIVRELVPYVDDGNPQVFQWPLNPALESNLEAGSTILNLSVVEVGKDVAGETVSIIVIPPITYKWLASQYVALAWLFLAWPLYVLLLIGHGFLLLRFSSPRWNSNLPVIDSKKMASRSPLMASIAVMTIFITMIYLYDDLINANFRAHLPEGLIWLIGRFAMYLTLLVSAVGLLAQKPWSRLGYLMCSTVVTVVWLWSWIGSDHWTISRLLLSSFMLSIFWIIVALIFRHFKGGKVGFAQRTNVDSEFSNE
jgi:hypothetical protein